MKEKPERRIAGVHVVMLGDFNPAILQPSWLASKGLIASEEAEAADIQVIRRELCAYRVEWLHMLVDAGRFEASTTDTSSFLPLRDFVVGLFEILEHTPVRRLGINCLQHFGIASEADWHALGDRLAPKEPWGGLLEGRRARGDGQRLPGLKSVAIEGKRANSSAVVSVKLEPSKRVPEGVYVEINEDYTPTGESADALQECLDVLRTAWQDAVDFAERVSLALLTGGNDQ